MDGAMPSRSHGGPRNIVLWGVWTAICAESYFQGRKHGEQEASWSLSVILPLMGWGEARDSKESLCHLLTRAHIELKVTKERLSPAS